MKQLKKLIGQGGATALLLGALGASAAERINITKNYDPTKLVPIALSGFAAETTAVLRFDLEAQGFSVVPQAKADFMLTGKASVPVEGLLQDRNKAVYFNKKYQGGNSRLQAHALSDDVVLAVTGKPGISRTKVMFKMVTGRRAREIYMADFDGFNARPLTQDKRLAASPDWAPGNQRVYYTSYWVHGGVENPTIVAHNLGTGQRGVFARFAGLNTSAAVGPLGRVAMVLSLGGSPDIYVARANWDFNQDRFGKQLTRLTKTKEAESSPAWSPDGQWLCFAAKSGGRRILVRAPAGGGGMQRITIAGARNPSEPAWSPDGRWIAFTAQMGGFQICVVPAGGGEAKVLTQGEDPSWAPNSRTLIFTRRGVNKRTLALLDVPTKQVKNIPAFAASSSQAAWQH